MKRLKLFIPPVVLAVITFIWLFCREGRWYTYHQEWPWVPLLILHILMPLYYLVMCIVTIVKHANKDKRTEHDMFNIIGSAVMIFVCCVGLLIYLIFTSGA
jgi:uncharacterized membrane protein YozB (DUF420 family)